MNSTTLGTFRCRFEGPFHTITLFVQETGFEVQNSMECELVMLLAGQAAEVAICGSISTCAGGTIGSDLHKTTEIAASMRRLYGMRGSKIWLGANADLTLTLSSNPNLSLAVGQDLQRAYVEAEAIVEKEVDWIKEVAGLLMAHREVGHSMVMDARPPGSCSLNFVSAGADNTNASPERNAFEKGDCRVVTVNQRLNLTCNQDSSAE